MPHLVRWNKEYPDLTIIDVDNGQRDTLEAVEKHVKDKKLPFIVVHDDKAVTVRRFRIKAYPMAYLIGADGKVIWNGHPHPGIVKELESKIAAAIKEAEANDDANDNDGDDDANDNDDADVVDEDDDSDANDG